MEAIGRPQAVFRTRHQEQERASVGMRSLAILLVEGRGQWPRGVRRLFVAQSTEA